MTYVLLLLRNSSGTGVDGVLNQAPLPILHNYWCSRPDWYGDLFHSNVSFCAGYRSGTRDSCSVNEFMALINKNGSMIVSIPRGNQTMSDRLFCNMTNY